MSVKISNKLPVLTKAQWNAIPRDYRSKWSGDFGHPEWAGRRTTFEGSLPWHKGGSTALAIEGIHFEIGN